MPNTYLPALSFLQKLMFKHIKYINRNTSHSIYTDHYFFNNIRTEMKHSFKMKEEEKIDNNYQKLSNNYNSPLSLNINNSITWKLVVCVCVPSLVSESNNLLLYCKSINGNVLFLQNLYFTAVINHVEILTSLSTCSKRRAIERELRQGHTFSVYNLKLYFCFSIHRKKGEKSLHFSPFHFGHGWRNNLPVVRSYDNQHF